MGGARGQDASADGDGSEDRHGEQSLPRDKFAQGSSSRRKALALAVSIEESLEALSELGLVAHDGAEAAEVVGEGAEADVEVGVFMAEAADTLAAALGEAGDDAFDVDALGELRQEVGLLPAIEVGSDEALFRLADEDRATCVGLGGDAVGARRTGLAARGGELEQPAFAPAARRIA